VSHPRVQFTVRRLMLVVLIVAALLAAFEAGRRWERAEKAGIDPFDSAEMIGVGPDAHSRMDIRVMPSRLRGRKAKGPGGPRRPAQPA
jgi:hypothetical protein